MRNLRYICLIANQICLILSQALSIERLPKKFFILQISSVYNCFLVAPFFFVTSHNCCLTLQLNINNSCLGSLDLELELDKNSLPKSQRNRFRSLLTFYFVTGQRKNGTGERILYR